MTQTRVLLDKISFTLPVDTIELQNNICDSVGEFKHDSIMVKYKGRDNTPPYYKKYQFDFNLDGKEFSMDFWFEPRVPSVNYFRCEFNPDHTGRDGLRMIRDTVFKEILGMSITRNIYFNCKTTRIDRTIDFIGIEDYFYGYNTTRNTTKSKIIPTQNGYPLQEIGSKKSDCYSKLYDKEAELLSRGIILDDFSGLYLRLENLTRKLNIPFSEIVTQTENPFRHYKFYSSSLLRDKNLDKHFRECVRDTGINHTLASVGNAKLDYLELMEPHEIDLLSDIHWEKEWLKAVQVLNVFRPRS